MVWKLLKGSLLKGQSLLRQTLSPNVRGPWCSCLWQVLYPLGRVLRGDSDAPYTQGDSIAFDLFSRGWSLAWGFLLAHISLGVLHSAGLYAGFSISSRRSELCVSAFLKYLLSHSVKLQKVVGWTRTVVGVQVPMPDLLGLTSWLCHILAM